MKDVKEINFIDHINKFNQTNKHIKILSGGDGTLISDWRNYRKHPLIPIRNYGLCDYHIEFYTDFFTNNESTKSLKQFLYPTIHIEGCNFLKDKDTEALAEIVILNDDITQCMRTNIYINDHLANSNVLSSGILISTKLGSTGYFKSITRTIFRSGIGLAFISPTYSIPNIILNETDKIRIEFIRNTKVRVSCDKLCYNLDVDKTTSLTISAACNNVSIFGYNQFMCEDCRRNRNSTIVNDSYLIQ